QLTGDAALGNNIRDFEALRTSGTGTLTLTGAQAFGAVAAGTDLVIGTGATLTADQVTFGDRDDAMTIAGGFAGSVDGGAGTDRLTVSGGSESAPILFRDIADVEQFAQESGFAALTGTASFTDFRLSGGRFVGKAGSMLSADRVIVDSQATFGSAGTVNGNVTVFGTLSPGASVATMTVNGNVALAAGSTSLFEIDESGADKLIINGSLTIDQGTTLQLEPTGTVRPGQSYDLILASGGITGQYSKIVKPDSLFGFVVQRADRIQLLGEFRGDARFSPQVARAIAYTNGLLARPVATSGFYDVVPLLAREDGSSDAQGFAALTPEAYASATQAGVEDALTVADTARGPAFGTQREAPGFFTFAQSVGQWRTLGADRQQGTAQAHMRGYGFLGGVGYGDATFSVGGFAGYVNMRQEIDGIEAQTKNDEFVAGIHARYAENGIGLAASFLYDGGKARTTRVVAGRNPVEGRYDLHSWVADLSGSYAIGLTDSWALNAKAGATVIRTNRDPVSEAGSPLALDVLSDSHVSGFVDGGIMVARGDASPARFRPFVGLGVRYQVEGRRAEAVGRFAGGPFTLEAVGAQRAAAVATASAGLSYRLKGGIDLFATASAQSGRDDHQQSASAGMRVRF
ncbi:MAG: autotransporter protein, partial [Sphingomonas sp.]|nr:autotransporter protein [Sphingomonas sp.]